MCKSDQQGCQAAALAHMRTAKTRSANKTQATGQSSKRGSYRTWSPDSAHSTATGAGDIKASLQAVSAEEQARLADSLSSSRVLVGAPRSAPGSGSSSRKRKGKGKAQGSWLARLSVLVGELQGRTAYAYFCWRQDTWSDLQLLMGINGLLVLIGGYVKAHIIDGGDEPPLGRTIYQVLNVVLGQDLPEESASAQLQTFALIVAVIGLAAFALVLALIEQLVLSVLEEQVRRGSRVYERHHILIAAWCENERDYELLLKVLAQLCYAYRPHGGRTVVVLSAREKLEMEKLTRRALPDRERYGTKLVFRQGSPLVPEDLRMVAASAAAATVLVSDSSRASGQADAEALRAAILLDELDFPGFGEPDTRGPIVVEIKEPHTLDMLQYSCSARVTALHTGLLNARRLVRMVTHPIVAATSNTLWSYSSVSQVYLHSFPQLEGKAFGELAGYFPQAVAFGVLRGKECLIDPDRGLRIQAQDEVMLVRPTDMAAEACQPLAQPVRLDTGGWSPDMFSSTSFDEQDSLAPEEVSHRASGLSGRAAAYGPAQGGEQREPGQSFQYMLPLEHAGLNPAGNTPQSVLVLGWGMASAMQDLLNEMLNGPARLPEGSRVTFFTPTISQQAFQRLMQPMRCHQRSVSLISGDPLVYADLAAKIDVTDFSTALVLCDYAWQDPDLDPSNGIYVQSRRGMLRLECQILLVQLHLRKLLEDGGWRAQHEDIEEAETQCSREIAAGYNAQATTLQRLQFNIIAEKVAVEGITRFEDRYRLPVGISVNQTSFAAKLLTQAVYSPHNVLVFSALGNEHELTAHNARKYTRPNELVSFWQLQARVSAVGQVLLGYYRLPRKAEAPIQFSINPTGDEWRSKPRVWSGPDARVHLVVLSRKRAARVDSLQPCEPLPKAASIRARAGRPQPVNGGSAPAGSAQRQQELASV